MEENKKIVTVTLNSAIDRVMEVDKFEVGAHMQAGECCRYPSGKGVNVSRALARLGKNSIIAGFVGRDQAKYFENNLTKVTPGKATNQLLIVRGVTRENITVLGKSKGTDTHLRTKGYELADDDLERVVSKLGLLLYNQPVIVFGGSLPGRMDESDFANLINLAIDSQAKVVLDLQPKLLSGVLGLGDDKPLNNENFESTQEKPFWMIAINQRQIAQLLNADELLTNEDILKFIKQLTVFSKWVIVSLSAHEAVLANSEGKIWRGEVKVKSKNVTSTVGSADCLLAGVLDAQSKGKQPLEVLRWGLAAAVANSAHVAVARFDLEQVNKWIGQISVHKAK